MTDRPRSRAWRRFGRNRSAMAAAAVLGAVVLACAGTLPWTGGRVDGQVRYDLQSTAAILLPPAAACPLGTDDLGRSVLVRLLYGGAISLAIGLTAASLSVAIGVAYGAIAGWCGGRVDGLMMRVVDVLYGLPYILLVILLKVALEEPLAALLGSSRTANIVVLLAAIGSVSWLTMARVVRGQVLSLKARPFIEAARASGASGGAMLVRHILPNLVGPVLVYATLTVPQAILQESFLSFLGIGVTPPTPTWGSMAADGIAHYNTIHAYWWLVVFPCAALGLTLLALNYLGDGLRDALDPSGESTDVKTQR
ncbi:MAG: ABC transporter permease [Planctomycetes bacterium]|nr:ABC transporter permease [Planctomycetota bacterium]